MKLTEKGKETLHGVILMLVIVASIVGVFIIGIPQMK